MQASNQTSVPNPPEIEADGASPPRTVEALRALTMRLGRGDALISMGSKAHSVLARLVERPEEVAVRTITELAESLGVNASTLTRLATRLGYAGFVEFQTVFRDGLASRHRHFYSEQAGRLVAHASERSTPQDGTGQRPEIDTMVQIAKDSIANTEGFLAQLSADELQQAARLLATAPRVRVHGLRQFSALASFLAYGLAMVRGDVALLDPHGLGVAEGLAQLQPGDLVVVTSVEPYTRSIAETAAAAAKAGMVVVAITDHRASPLAAFAKHSFFVPHGSAFFSNSMGAYVIFCEGLLNLVATDLGKKALKALERRERFIADLGIE
ncbi:MULTISPECIES: MurR/RpiR family transcriptional regulator [Variovorax]|jgi:DNA-binding MurR/RpiR family transcriptional regulator|uniref:MurR/RpiR family transcriptional regulator n=1 Tax=Variovorax TaxID=34072 RepID=UPI001F458027|nr:MULTISPECIES: MurR/RpiR family transcriptional regulator [Variovorax]UKI05818.1 MurR/RpiR family transcriptional regulator [Variovorax paradoxus]